MEINDLQNKLVAVLGYGVEGEAIASYLVKHGIKPTLFDRKPWDLWSANKQKEIKSLGVNFIFGPETFLELKGFEVAFRSPGVKLADINSAVGDKSKLEVTSQTKWFFENCPAKIIGVTGTKGKGTTATLISEILKLNFKSQISNIKIFLTGNIGKVQPFEILDNLKADDWVVYELSSFQLQDLKQSPHIGVVLMTTSEHLDYHASVDEYRKAKEAIVKYQTAEDFAIINDDFEPSKKIGKISKAKKLYFSRKNQVKEGCYVKDGEIIISNSDFRFPISELQLRGAHNYENVCASVLVAKSAGCADESIKDILREFKGLEHRLEFVADKNGIKFYNDSFSTTPETAIAAINAFIEPEIIILGGSSKNSDFTELTDCIVKASNIKAFILIGTEADHLKRLLEKNYTGQLIEGAKNLSEVFDQIKQIAQSGDVVLLSPSCASFDWFENYKVRGEEFKGLVQQFYNENYKDKK